MFVSFCLIVKYHWFLNHCNCLWTAVLFRVVAKPMMTWHHLCKYVTTITATTTTTTTMQINISHIKQMTSIYFLHMYFRKNCIVVDTTDLTHAKLVSLTSPCCSGEPRPPVQRAPVTWREWGLWSTPRTTFCSSNGLVLGKPIDRPNVKSTYTTDTRRNNNGIIASKRHRFSVINALSLIDWLIIFISSSLTMYRHIDKNMYKHIKHTIIKWHANI